MIKEMSMWQNLLEENNVITLNGAIAAGRGRHIIHLAEAMHEHCYCELAEKVAAKKGIKLVLIAGPSSSGKTTSSKRLALHLRVIGLNPIVIGMDDYFKPRELTPRDKKGDYDFECLEAMDVEFLNAQLSSLFAGEEIEVPHYDFTTGTRVFDGSKLKMKENDIVIMEGIHGLNPDLTPLIPDEKKFKIFVSVLTPIVVDAYTEVSAADYRLLRRIVRDNQFRNYPADQTILRWPSVRAGEKKNINPFFEAADEKFNSAVVYELPMLKCYAEPLLQVIPPTSPAYSEAQHLLDILHDIIALTPVEVNNIPPTSIIREFIGGSSFRY